MDYFFRNPNKVILGNYNDRYHRAPTYFGSSGYMDGLVDTDEIIENVAEQLKQDGVFDSIIVDEEKIANNVVKYLQDHNLLGSTDQTTIINTVISKLKADTEFLNSIKGKDGVSPTASEVATQLKNDSDFKASVKGDPGDSPSAADVAAELKADEDFVAACKGEPGADANAIIEVLKEDSDFTDAIVGEVITQLDNITIEGTL